MKEHKYTADEVLGIMFDMLRGGKNFVLDVQGECGEYEYGWVCWGHKKDIASIYRSMYKAREKGVFGVCWGGAFDYFTCPEFSKGKEFYGIYFHYESNSVFVFDGEGVLSFYM